MDIETVFSLVQLALMMYVVVVYFKQCRTEEKLRKEIRHLNGENEVQRARLARLHDDLNHALGIK